MIERTLDRIKLHREGSTVGKQCLSRDPDAIPHIVLTTPMDKRGTYIQHADGRGTKKTGVQERESGEKTQDQQGAGGLLLLTCVRIKRRSSSRLALCSFWASTDHAVDPKAFRCGNMSPSRCHDWQLGGRLPLGKEGGEARKRRGEV